jgi:mannose-6-phosphate isomerase
VSFSNLLILLVWQAHAEELHAKFPNIYKDPNHKPEMLVTLSKFQMLRGFRPVSDIKLFLLCKPSDMLLNFVYHCLILAVPEMREVLGADVAYNLISCSQDQEQEALKQAYRAMMTASDATVTKCLSDILSRVSTSGKLVILIED